MVAIAVLSTGLLAITPQASRDKPGPGEMLQRVQRAVICGSDIQYLHGSNRFVRYTGEIGHESAGHVFEAGADLRQPGSAIEW